MGKNRETTTLGHLLRGSVAMPAPAALVRAQADKLEADNRTALAKLIESETAAAHAHADKLDEQLATGLYPSRGADPATIVGLDGLTPDGDTAGDGDSERTDPNAG